MAILKMSRPAAGSLALLLAVAGVALAEVKPGDVITKENATKVQDLVSPGNFLLVKQGMAMKIVVAERLEWPPGYKAATEKYSAQVGLSRDGLIKNYVAGQPFPLLDANDPSVATKIMWNFSFRPLYTDDIDARYPEVATFKPGTSQAKPVGYFSVGHFAFYNNIGRTEVPPVPTDPDSAASGIRYRFGFYPFLDPAGLHGYGLIRYRHIDPRVEDNSWVYNPQTRRLRRQSASSLSDAISGLPGFGGGGGGGEGTGVGASGGEPFSNNLDPDSYFGFSAKVEDFTYKFLGQKLMLACVHATHSPASPCPYDGSRTICPENWEERQLYVVEATVKPNLDLSIQRRILYIDSEGWFVTASDQYDRNGELWKTIAAYHTYRDRPVPDARVAIYPYKRIFQTALVDQDVVTGASSVVYMPGPDAPERECWYIDMGTVNNSFFVPQALQRAGH